MFVPLLLAVLSSPLAFAGEVILPSTLPNFAACVNEPLQFSCENTTTITNTCCSPTPGGLVLQTQFWDLHTGLESEGQLLPANSWGIHGLWPDFCDGWVLIIYLKYVGLIRFCFAGALLSTVTYRGNSTRHRHRTRRMGFRTEPSSHRTLGRAWIHSFLALADWI